MTELERLGERITSVLNTLNRFISVHAEFHSDLGVQRGERVRSHGDIHRDVAAMLVQEHKAATTARAILGGRIDEVRVQAAADANTLRERIEALEKQVKVLESKGTQ